VDFIYSIKPRPLNIPQIVHKIPMILMTSNSEPAEHMQLECTSKDVVVCPVSGASADSPIMCYDIGIASGTENLYSLDSENRKFILRNVSNDHQTGKTIDVILQDAQALGIQEIVINFGEDEDIVHVALQDMRHVVISHTIPWILPSQCISKPLLEKCLLILANLSNTLFYRSSTLKARC
jgi:hypothetical protein